MDLLDALTIVRKAALFGPLLTGTEAGRAMKVVNRKIASLERKRAWRQSIAGTMPPHARHPEHPLNLQ